MINDRKLFQARIKTAPIPRVQNANHGYRTVPPTTLPLLSSPQFSGGVTPVSAVTGGLVSPADSVPSSLPIAGYVTPVDGVMTGGNNGSCGGVTTNNGTQSNNVLFIPASPVQSAGAQTATTTVQPATLITSPVISPPWACPASFFDLEQVKWTKNKIRGKFSRELSNFHCFLCFCRF